MKIAEAFKVLEQEQNLSLQFEGADLIGIDSDGRPWGVHEFGINTRTREAFDTINRATKFYEFLIKFLDSNTEKKYALKQKRSRSFGSSKELGEIKIRSDFDDELPEFFENEENNKEK